MSNYLIHYASEYYDPVKAHEYYEEHKKLKGRKSTSELNEEGKYAAEYVKERINAERDKALELEAHNKERKIESAQATKDNSIENYSRSANAAITRLQSRLKKMTKAEKARNYETISNEIAKLREDNKMKKAAFQERFKTDKSDIQGSYKKNVESLRTKYNDLYLDELDKIKSEAKYQKTKKSKSKSKSKGSSSKLHKGDLEKYRSDHRTKAGVSYK